MQLFFKYNTQFKYSPTSIIAALTAFDAGTLFVDDFESLKEMPYNPPDEDVEFELELAFPSIVRA